MSGVKMFARALCIIGWHKYVLESTTEKKLSKLPYGRYNYKDMGTHYFFNVRVNNVYRCTRFGCQQDKIETHFTEIEVGLDSKGRYIEYDPN
jgi:hypothetical protein